MDPRRAGLAIALGLSAAFAAAVAAAAVASPASMDAVALYAGARLVATGEGARLVDPEAVLAAEHAAAPERTALLPFVQPPAVALLLAPFGLLPFQAAYPLMAALEALGLAAAAALLADRAARDRPLLGALVLIAPPAALAIAQAQTSPLVLLLVAVAARSGPRAGGLALGLTLLRPQTAPLFLLAGIADGARRAWTVGGALAVVLASAIVVGPEGMARYIAQLVGAAAWSVSGELGLRASIGWAAPAVALGAGWIGLAAAAASLVVASVVVLRTAPDARPAVAAAWSLLASPHVLLHDGVLALPALVALARASAAWPLAAAAGWIAHAAVAPIGLAVSLAVAVAPRPRTRP